LALSKLKNALKGQKFADIPDIPSDMTLLQGIPENDFQARFSSSDTIISQSA
jgi:hypothetical protein